MEKGFYLLQPEIAKHFEGLLQAMKDFEKYGIWICFPRVTTDEKEEMHLTPFSVWFDIVEKEEKFFVRMKMRGINKKVVATKLLPSSRQTPKEFFTLIRNYLDQKLKRKKLSQLLLSILENQDEELTKVFLNYKETYNKKIEAVKAQTFDKAAEFRGEEVKLIKKMSLISKRQISTKRGFKWITDDHVLDVIKEL